MRGCTAFPSTQEGNLHVVRGTPFGLSHLWGSPWLGACLNVCRFHVNQVGMCDRPVALRREDRGMHRASRERGA
jgi:hypothetical protein